jgi:hypothetical protein
MTIERVRAALRSGQRNVLVEAPAGCGKTFEAALLATDLAASLPAGREILLLAHTNAAVQEFGRRTQAVRQAVRISTIDAFCLQLLEGYAGALALPAPLRRNVGLGGGRVDFSELAPKALELLTRCPSLSRILGLHYPVIILDEHQDARPDQHAVAQRIAEAGGARLRIFADPMQAIYERGDRGVECGALVRGAAERFELDTPQRWQEAPLLGEWIMRARAELRAGQPLPIENRPDSVRTTLVAGMADPGYGRGQPQFLSRPVHEFLNRCDGTAAVLTYSNRMAWDLQICAATRVMINEGADFEAAYGALELAQAATGSRRQLAIVLLDTVASASTGLNQQRRTAIERVLGDDELRPSRSADVRSVLPSLQRIYEAPNVAGFCAGIEVVLRDPPDWLTIRLSEMLRVLSRIRALDEDALESP